MSAGPTPAPSDVPAFLATGGRAPLRFHARRAWLRLRWGRRVSLGRGAFVGRGVRLTLAGGARLELGEGAWLGNRATVRAGGRVTIGAGTLVGPESMLAARELVEVGAGCLVGDEAMLSDAALTAEDALEGKRPVTVRPVRVGDGARIGPRACVLADVAPGAVVGARVVVGGSGERPQ